MFWRKKKKKTTTTKALQLVKSLLYSSYHKIKFTEDVITLSMLFYYSKAPKSVTAFN